MLLNCVSPPVLGTTTACRHGQRTRLAHEAVVGVPVGAVNEPPAVAEFVAILAGYDAHLGAIGMLRKLRAPNRHAKDAHGITEGDGPELLVADAKHETCKQSLAQFGLCGLGERRIEIETADRRRHRLR
jgi:hypothetical protein